MKHILDNNTLILQMQSDLIASKVRDLVEDTKRLIEGKNNFTKVVLDIGKSSTIDSIGISFIIGIYKSTVKYGKTFNIAGANEDIKQLFSLMKLDEIFKF